MGTEHETGDSATETGQLPDVVKVLTDLLGDLQANVAGYLLAGLGYMLVAFGMVFVFIALLVGFMVIPMIIGAALGSEELGAILAMVGMLFGYVVGLLLLVTVSAPFMASLARAARAHLEGDQPLGFVAAFGHLGTDIVQVLLLSILQMALVLIGMMFCYLPGLLVSLALGFAFPALIVHRLSAISAIQLSFGHVRRNLGWHLGFWGLGLAILFVAQAIPLVGVMFGLPFYVAYQLKVYMLVFGSGPEPSEA
ncbi:MAG: hypothetical protein JRI25_06080 [Deltaproteobacteria bacterium]|nr:hypothetical protein [Deltaproteobacteria bacterium]